ncbi:MAG: hypothetical protein JO034_18865 [Singulisphaera sp.]|nr:hypothetical protein [Singulisphaera sp.]
MGPIPPTACTPTLWARLPIEQKQQLHDLLGQLLARPLTATRHEEADHD